MSSPGEQPLHQRDHPEAALVPRATERFTDGAEYAEVIRTALERYGASFLAWLMLDGVDQVDRRIVDKFEDAYAGWYPTRHDLCRAQLENLGWTDALAGFRTGLGLPPHALDFDWARIWDHCLDVYSVEERLDGVHAFLR